MEPSGEPLLGHVWIVAHLVESQTLSRVAEIGSDGRVNLKHLFHSDSGKKTHVYALAGVPGYHIEPQHHQATTARQLL